MAGVSCRRGRPAVFGSFVASTEGRRGGGEDPWLCGPGFRRVCRYRGMVESELEAGTLTVKTLRGSQRGLWKGPLAPLRCPPSPASEPPHRVRARAPPSLVAAVAAIGRVFQGGRCPNTVAISTLRSLLLHARTHARSPGDRVAPGFERIVRLGHTHQLAILESADVARRDLDAFQDEALTRT